MKKFFLIWGILLGMAGCRTYQDSVQECPPPPQPVCAPGSWSGTRIDTSRANLNRDKFYRAIDPLSSVNTPRDEFQVSFLDSKRGIVTRTERRGDYASTGFLSVNVAAPDNLRPAGAFAAEQSEKIGNISAGRNSLLLAMVPEESLTSDADIYTAAVSGAGLASVQSMRELNSPLWDSHPALSPDGRIVFFASDREGGFGGTDIWYSIRQESGIWSEARNCGSNINTPCDEITPFVTPDGRHLLFSSNGHQTVGGYDIFRSDLDRGFIANRSFQGNGQQSPFAPAANYGAPLNTSADELFPSSYAEPDSVLYYASNQDNPEESAELRGGFDLYVMRKIFIRDPLLTQGGKKLNPREDKLEVRELEPISRDPDSTFTFEGEVRDPRQRPIDSADITVKVRDRDRVIDQTRTDENGKFSLELPRKKDLEITAEKENLFYEKFRLRVDDTTSKISHSFILPEKLFLRVNFPTDQFDNPYEFVLDSNGAETGENWRESIKTLADNILRYRGSVRRILLVGHTDDMASDAYNMQLGRRRVNFVVDELVRLGVPRELLQMRSAGEREPLQQRAGEDIETYRKRLRRVELSKVMKR